MKSIALCCLMIIPGFFAFGQSVMVFSQNKCYLDKVETLKSDAKEKFKPILDNLVNEKKLISWQIYEHGWGDEWNYNVLYVAESQEKFLEAFREFAKRASERYPETFKIFQEACFEHKDSIYSLVTEYTSPVAKN